MAHLGDPVTPPTTPLQCRHHQIWMLPSAPPHFFFIKQRSRLLPAGGRLRQEVGSGRLPAVCGRGPAHQYLVSR